MLESQPDEIDDDLFRNRFLKSAQTFNYVESPQDPDSKYFKFHAWEERKQLANTTGKNN